jgi:anti-sigma regulatory factor (Ser/Thr protein kinase)
VGELLDQRPAAEATDRLRTPVVRRRSGARQRFERFPPGLSSERPIRPGVSDTGPVIHRALLYDGEADFVSGTTDVIDGALDRDEPVLVALPTEHLDQVRDRIGSPDVTWVDMTCEGRNPGRILPAVLTAFEAANRGRPVTMIGEPMWPGRTAEEYSAAVAHEALINLAFDGRAVTVVCPYDAGSLSPRALADARRTHPEVGDTTGYRSSADYADPVTVARDANRQLSPVPAEARSMPIIVLADLLVARQLVTTQCRLARMDGGRGRRFTLAVHEACANALIHGDGVAELFVWRSDADLVAEVRSPATLVDPLAGRRAAPVDAIRGRGLILINEICDVVQLAGDETGTTIRMRLAIR